MIGICGALSRGRMPLQARVGEAFDRAPVRDEAGAAIGGQRGRVIERAGVDVDSAYAFAPGAPRRLGKKPAAVAHAGQFGNEADEGEFALVRLAEVELEHSGVAAALVHDLVELDPGVLDDRREMRVVEDQPRKPQPRRSDEPE